MHLVIVILANFKMLDFKAETQLYLWYCHMTGSTDW